MQPFLDHVRDTLTDHRFVANLTATYGTVVVLVLLSLVVRRLLGRGGDGLAEWTGLHWLDHLGRAAARRARLLLARLTWAMIGLMTVAGVAYHAAGRDVRHDVHRLRLLLRDEEWLSVGLRAAAVFALAALAWVGVRVVRRGCAELQPRVVGRLGRAVHEEAVRRWFSLFQRFGCVAVCLGALWGAGHAVGLNGFADLSVGFVFRVLTIVVVARLLTLAFRAVSRVAAHAGDQRLAAGKWKHYWERVKLLFPFGERCFEAAVWVEAAALGVAEFRFVAFVADYGSKVVHCIGIFFVTRVLIELSYVLLHEAFGLYKPASAHNQKGRTLAPLLHSTCQYVFYFGSGLAMLRALGVDTTPILAGAGIIGLAVGLGAQSLVTDVVSGFFILFEGQYLVGDFVQIGDAVGVVEAVGIRVTQVRDARGKLYLIPNGQIKGVVNYSKGYVNAVVDLKVPAGSDLGATFRRMTEAGRRLKAAHDDVLADTEVQGVVELGTAEMTVRAVTKVKPGAHEAMENEYRRLLKAVLDEAAPAGPVKLAA